MIDMFKCRSSGQDSLIGQASRQIRERGLVRAVAGVGVMLLGVGVTFLGRLLSQGHLFPIEPTTPVRLYIILSPMLLGSGLFVAGVTMTGKSRVGIASALGMGAAVLLVGLALYVLGLTGVERGQVWFLLSGMWLVWLGLGALAVGLTRAGSAKTLPQQAHRR